MTLESLRSQRKIKGQDREPQKQAVLGILEGHAVDKHAIWACLHAYALRYNCRTKQNCHLPRCNDAVFHI